ncbi:Dipeptidyl aminopeptidase/acylaminoacyl peptidase [Sphingomonas laterariae]|uniref:Dipeptidyl aminopeptidase/acylaminoacyl peptidase n=1 Tax=Edaphosphingomonas laterariae TaxID=861865 RepID=A0A239BFF0_9SPHN|nr:S9 family peptidase [Sphingomonas laterariae]SNS06660.1 Dipeptidyl aminopeptidase/acylaminoacyl peptidase [Sphingomonas laterariae]
MTIYRLCALIAVASLPTALHAGPFRPPDAALLKDISDPAFSHDGAMVAYSVEAADTKRDKATSDIWVASWAEGQAKPLTRTPAASEWQPDFSGDGKYVAFLSDAGKSEETQLWRMRVSGSSPRQVTRINGGISDFCLSPDGRVAIVVAEVGGRVGVNDKPTAPPIVVSRFQSKEDGRGWLDARRKHLFRVDMAKGTATQITSGDFDHWLPSWSPDGRMIAFVARRDAAADRGFNYDVFVMPAGGGEPRRLGQHKGADHNPDWDAGRPQWSADSRRLAWVRAGDDQWLWYSPHQLAIGDVATGSVTMPANIDRWIYKPHWTSDGQIVALVEQDRDTWLARLDPVDGTVIYLTQGAGFASDLAVGTGDRIAIVEGNLTTPAQLRRADGQVLADHNPWLSDREFAAPHDVSWISDGVTIGGILTLPSGHREGQKHPLVVRLHGGPVYQFSHEFMLDWQVYAARGFAVLAVNPRGSSGRGFDFARAIFADWGNKDVADVKAGIDHVIAMGVIDPARIGVSGWSYGGILTDYMIASDPRIRAAVSGAGIANLFGGYGADQYSRDYELELGTPWANPDVYAKLSYPFLRADRIAAATLFLCAEKDLNVPCLGSEQMFQALRSRDVPTQLVVYPGENHGLTVPSYKIDRLQRHIDWFTRYLALSEPAPHP